MEEIIFACESRLSQMYLKYIKNQTSMLTACELKL